jgi:hypothetical protein
MKLDRKRVPDMDRNAPSRERIPLALIGELMRRPPFLIAAGGVFVITTALPASAATSGRTEMTAIDSAGPTTTTFTVTNGALTITTPDSVNLGSGAPGTTIGPTALGTVTANDNRASASASWAATVSSTDFTSGSQTIPAPDATYTTGTVAKTGTITITSVPTLTLTGAAQTVVSGTAGIGDNSATWDPTIAIAVPVSAVAGLYSGTITHSVS